MYVPKTITAEKAHREFWLQINSITLKPCIVPQPASFRKGVTFWASLINNLVAFVGTFISVFVDKHGVNSAQFTARAGACGVLARP